MKQIPRFCMIVDHGQRQIEKVCMFPECNLNRLICNQCLRAGNHKHSQQDQSHILDYKEFYEVLQERIKKRQSDLKLMVKGFQRIIYELNNLIFNISNMMQEIEQFMDQNNKSYQSNDLLLKQRINEFDICDNNQLNSLLNIEKQIGYIITSLLNKSNRIIQNSLRIQEGDYSKKQQNLNIKQQIRTKLKATTKEFQEQFLRILDISCLEVKERKQKYGIIVILDNIITYIKFTDDSNLLYVGKQQDLYQFYVNNNFKKTYKQRIHSSAIINIFCITNTIILTSSCDNTIIKTDINLKQQLLLIKAHDDRVYGLDYNHNFNIIASSSFDKSIKLWNGNNGNLVLEKQKAHNKCDFIFQVLFITKKNQLLSLDNFNTIIIWNINYHSKKIEQQRQMGDKNGIYNMSLVLNQQYITLVCQEYIKIYTIKGDFLRQFNHDVKDFFMYSTIQPHNMKALIIQGQKFLKICKVDIL